LSFKIKLKGEHCLLAFLLAILFCDLMVQSGFGTLNGFFIIQHFVIIEVQSIQTKFIEFNILFFIFKLILT
jgi:hypothetical protein